MNLNAAWNAAREERHRCEHNVEEAEALLAASRAELRLAREEQRAIEAKAFASRVTLKPAPLPRHPLGVRVL